MNSPDFKSMRGAMVDSQLRTVGVNDMDVVRVMREVPREAFVPAGRASLAYVDEDLPIAPGRVLSKPAVVGRLLTRAAVRPGERVLLVGAATGYAAALLAKLGAVVTALESDAALAESARGNLAAAGVQAVDVRVGPLAEGAPDAAPFDLILFDGAIELVPAAIVAQLAPGGRIAAPLVNDAGVCQLALGRAQGGHAGFVAFADVATLPLPGFARPRGFQF